MNQITRSLHEMKYNQNNFNSISLGQSLNLKPVHYITTCGAFCVVKKLKKKTSFKLFQIGLLLWNASKGQAPLKLMEANITNYEKARNELIAK